MDIVYYLYNFPKISETFILNEIAELENKGHNIAIFALNRPETEIEHEELEELGAEIYYPEFPGYSDFIDLIKPNSLKPAFLKTLNISSGVKNKLVQAHRATELIEFIERADMEPDLIHTHFSTKSKTPVYTVSELKNIPWTIEVHAYDIFQKDTIRFSRKFLRKPDTVITISEYNKNYLREKFSLETPIYTVPVSINTEKFSPQGLEEKNKIVSVARLVEKKGLEYGIEAFAEVKDEFPQLEYDIIGKGELMSELKEEAEKLEVIEDVNFRGHVSDEELVKSMEEAKIFLLPCIVAENGDRDGIPTVLKESMSLKTPCISTGVSGIPELIEDGEDGFVCEPKNIKEIASKIQKLIKSEDKRSEMGEKARQKIISEHSVSANIGKIEESFRKTKNAN